MPRVNGFTPAPAAPLPESERAGFRPLPEWTAPLVWTPQGKRPVYRFFAHLLIRLLVLMPMPVECQAWAFFFPSSLLWSLTSEGPAEGNRSAREKEGAAPPSAVPRRPASGRPPVRSLGAGERTRQPIVEKIGGRIAFGENGSILFGTAYKPWGGEAGAEQGGVRAATMDVIGAVRKPRPTFARPVVAAMGARAATGVPLEETTKDIPIKVNVFPLDTETERAELQLFNGALLAMAPVPVPFVGGGAMFTLAAGFQRAVGEATTAILRFFTKDGREVKSTPQPIPIGRLVVRVDSDNDTKMGSLHSAENLKDEKAAAEGKAFVFWQRDEVRKDDDALIDLARVSIQRYVKLDPAARVALRIPGASWDAYRRIDAEDLSGRITVDCAEDGKLHLCNKDGVTRQLALMESKDPREVITGSGDTKEIPYDVLTKRPQTTEILFRCLKGCLSAEAIQVGEILPTGVFSPLAEAKIDFEEFRQLASMLTVRQARFGARTWTDDQYKVASQAQDEPYWLPLSTDLAAAKQVTMIVHGYAVSHDEFTSSRQPGRDANTPAEFETLAKRLYWAGHPILGAQEARVVGVSWPGDIPGDVNQAVQKLLGVDEVRPYFIEDEFNAFLSGIPLGDKLRELRSGRKVNILAHSLGNVVVNSALERAGSGGKPINYVMLQAAVPSDAFLQQYDPLNARRSVPGVGDLVGHAIALGFPDELGVKADRKWLEQENEVFQKLGEFPGEWTCPRQAPFEVRTDPDCLNPELPKPWPLWKCDGSRCDNATRFFKGFDAVDSGLNPVATDFGSAPTQPSYFNTRWGKFSRNDDGSLQSAWTRLFDANVTSSSTVRVFNAYNRDDFVLRIDRPYHEGLPVTLLMIQAGVTPVTTPAIVAQLHSSTFHAWKMLQMLGKPFASAAEYPWSAILADIGRGGAGDDLSRQKWWTLEVDGRPSPWQTSKTTPAWVLGLAGGDRQWIRRRAELAMWYPALSPPAGVVPLDALTGAPGIPGLDVPSQGGNIDLSTVGGKDGPNEKGTPSHSYMSMKKYQEVWKGFRAFQTAFEQ